jgi:hypothetical protein
MNRFFKILNCHSLRNILKLGLIMAGQLDDFLDLLRIVNRL